VGAVINRSDYGDIWTLGENLLVGPAGMPIDQMEQVWMNSPGHRANILSPRFTRIGIGAVRTTSGRWWATQDFVTPLTGS